VGDYIAKPGRMGRTCLLALITNFAVVARRLAADWPKVRRCAGFVIAVRDRGFLCSSVCCVRDIVFDEGGRVSLMEEEK
jgi:hypothetical protein